MGKASLTNINTLREQYHRLSVGKESLLALINEAEISEQVYNSNAIENSTVSLEETEKILLHIDLERYITERELFETKNLAHVVTYINARARDQELTAETILLLHKMLLSHIDDAIAGRFRREGEYVRFGSHIAPPPDVIPLGMQKLLTDYAATAHTNIVAGIARIHLAFEHLHPFCDGNGRIGRVINNYQLIRAGYVPINIKFIDRARYYDAFKAFNDTGSTTGMEAIVEKALLMSYHKRLTYLSGASIIPLSEYAKKKGLRLSSLINKAHRQTIPAFMEKGVWKIGDNSALSS
jgi:Fic family protein